MAVSFVGATSGNTGSATATSQVTSFHGSWQAGDTAILTTHWGGNTIDVNSGMTGWTSIGGTPVTQGTNSRGRAYRRVLQGGDSAPTIGYDGSITGGWTMEIYRGGHQTSPVGQSGTASGNATSLATSSLTGVLAGSALAVHVGGRVPTGTTPPTGITPDGSSTEAADHGTSRTVGTSQNVRMEAAYRLISSAGNYGGDSWSMDGGVTCSIIAFHIEVVPGVTTVNGGLPAETDTALTGSGRKYDVGGLPAETDSGLAGTGRKSRTGGLPATTETALAGTARKIRGGGLATTADSVLAGAVRRIVAAGLGVEADSALAGSVGGTVVVNGGLAVELNVALAGSVATPGAVIHRPFTGTVARPSFGVIVRPNTGVISRP